jgi:endonuclease/exonuclease/phosphatase family metal-dependent hydrolase
MILRIANIIIFPLTLISGVLLSAAGLAPFIHPKYSTLLPLLGLTFPFLFIVNIIWLIYWWVQLKLKLVIPLCFLVLNLIHISKYIQYTGEKNAATNGIKIASFNTQLFGNYQDSNYFGSTLSKVRTENFSILCLQEFYAKNKLNDRINELKKEGHFRAHYFQKLTSERPYGMVIYSIYPIVKTGRIGFGENTGNMAIFADILIDSDTVRVYNIHLQSIRFVKEDYAFINNLQNEDSKIEGSKNIIRRMGDACIKRASQADSVAENMAACPYLRIVMGDFNDVPLSYAYNRVSNDLLDAFRECGNGFEKTYKGPFPSFRIDYIFMSKSFRCVTYRSLSDVAGDHKMIVANIEKGPRS